MKAFAVYSTADMASCLLICSCIACVLVFLAISSLVGVNDFVVYGRAALLVGLMPGRDVGDSYRLVAAVLASCCACCANH